FGIEQTEQGSLVILLGFRSVRARSGFGATRTVDGRAVSTIDDFGQFFDTRVLVVDPIRREILATHDVDDWIISPVGRGLFWAIAPGGEHGSGSVRIGRVRFEK